MNIRKNIFTISKFLLVPLLIYTCFFSFYAGSYFSDIANTYQLPGYDQDGSSFIKNVFLENIKNLDFPRFTDRVQYPSGWSLVGIPLGSIVDYLVIYPGLWFQSGSIFYWHNINTVFASLTAGLFSFLLCYRLSKNYFGSIIGGYIFGFTSLNLIYVGGNDPLTSIEFLPIAFLMFFRFLDKKTLWRLLLVIFTITLNYITSIYWGWFLSITIVTVVLVDSFIFKKYFNNIFSGVRFLFVIFLISGFLSVLLNLNFFFNSFKYLLPSESKKVDRSASSQSFVTSESPYRFLIPNFLSLWPEQNNAKYDYAISYLPISVAFLTLILLTNIKKLTKDKQWALKTSILLIGLYVLMSSSPLQVFFRRIMPPIVAYSRTLILINLLFGVIVSISLGYLIKFKSVLLAVVVGLLVIADTVRPGAVYTTNLKRDLPKVVSFLEKAGYSGEGSILFFPWICNRYGYGNLLYQVIHKWPIANPYFQPVDGKSEFLCRDVNNYKSRNLKDYISLFDVRYVIAYPNVGIPIDIDELESNLGGCAKEKMVIDKEKPTKDLFDQYRNATIFEIDQKCTKKTLITQNDFVVENRIQLVEAGQEQKALHDFIKKESAPSMYFIAFGDLTEEQKRFLDSLETPEIKFDRMNKYEYNITIPAHKKGIVITLNTPPINLDGWELYKINHNGDQFDLTKKYEQGKGFFFETNLHKTSVFIDPSTKDETYKIVFPTYFIDRQLQKITDIATIIFLLVFSIVIIIDIKSTYKSNEN